MQASRLFFFICWLGGIYLSIHHVSGQASPDIQLIGVNEGLSHRDVLFTTRDTRGFLWIINSGIDFYDGHSFTSYHKFDQQHYIPVSSIRAGCKLQDSLLIFTEAKDLYALHLDKGTVATFTYPEGMPTDFNDLVTISDRQHQPNILLFTRSASGTSVNVINRQWKFLFNHHISNQSALHHKILRSYANGPDGVIWLLDQDESRIWRIDSTQAKPFPFPEAGKHPELSYRIIYLENFGLVVCRHDGLILHLDEGEGKVKTYMRVPYPGRNLNPAHIDRQGWIWCMSERQMVKFEVRTKISHLLDVNPFGRFQATLRSSFEDHEGIIWISSDVGLLRILPEPKPFHSFFMQTDSDRNFQIRDIMPATDQGVYCRAFDSETVLLEMRLRPDMKVDTIIRLRKIPRQGMYLRHEEHIYHVRSGAPVLEKYQLPDFQKEIVELPFSATTQYYNLFTVDSTGMLYYQDVNNNLTAYHPDTRATFTIELEPHSQKLNSPWRTLQFSGSDRILIGTETTGLLVYGRKSGRRVKEFNVESRYPLSGNFVNAVLQESDSIVWVGTLGSGVNRVNLESGLVRVYTTQDGLANNLVANMLQDEFGNIWIGTYGGLSMYNKSDDHFYNYKTTDGLSDNEFNYRSAFRDAQGRMFMGTLNGMTVFEPGKILGQDPLPPVQLTRIQRYNRQQDLLISLEHDLEADRVIRVSPYDNYIDFQFTVPSYRNNETHIYFSWLKGVDADWQNLGHRPSIRYQKLPPGQYQLELMASDANGNKTLQPTVIRFQVQQVFYKSFWFLTLIAFSLVMAGYSLYRYRVRMLQKDHQTRTRIASDLHDEVGGSLTGLFLQLQMMEIQAAGEQRSHLAKVSTVIDQSITKMRDLVWSIDARSDRWGRMIERMEDYASEVLFPLDIQFIFQYPTIDLQQQIDARIKHNLYLIYKEAIHNIAKHSQARMVWIRFEKTNHQLIMEVQDNGQPGLSKTGLSGQGLQNMQMRAERLKGTLNTGYQGEGYLVHLEVPV